MPSSVHGQIENGFLRPEKKREHVMSPHWATAQWGDNQNSNVSDFARGWSVWKKSLPHPPPQNRSPKDFLEKVEDGIP